MSLRLNDLKNFLEVSGCQTFSSAARKLSVTQPSLSESIRRLELDLGQTLFYRSKSGIELTPEGRRAVERARLVTGLISEMQEDSKEVRPLITIGCHPVVASYVLPQALVELIKTEPKYRVALEHGLSRTVQEQIQNGRVDIGVVINPVANPDLVIRKLAVDHFYVWMHPQGPLQPQMIYDPEVFQAQTILRRWKKRPTETLTSPSLELVARLTAARIGYGILPERAVELVGAQLVRVANTPEYRDEICLLHRPEFGKTLYEKNIIKSLSGALTTP